VTPARGNRVAGRGLRIEARGMGRQHQKALRAGERQVGHSNVGPGRRRGRGASEKRGGEGENRWPRLETLKPRRLTNLGKGPTAPMPMPVKGGQRGGVDGDERGLTRVRSLLPGSHLIAMPVCLKARCRVKPVKGHRGRGVPWAACFNQGPRGRGGWEGGVPEPGVACLRRRETEAGG